MVISYVIENHKQQRIQMKTKICSNKFRLGEFILQKDPNSKNHTELWIDGYDIKNTR